ncbi:CBU_0592 family membrane protein [Ktedonospora formicarum]|uniref:CBU-0592-like domain-containing protein n=1 Tax=Ktedonospora formicarum TaxID=2778364 RepID=A0A8J3MY53_9CHLR|nr:hypothetical protein [Ktedonospora formicarum]GHO50666.1 hypothetical protein KSX_88290 [Ktedonospora formicarum]
MSGILQIVGALMVLGGFALSQFRVLSQQSYPYLLLNVIGSGVLAILAALDFQWGFLMLEGGWALVSCWSVFARIREGIPGSAH